MVVYLGQVVAHGVDHGLVVAFQLGGRLQRADVEGQLLRAIKEQLDAAETRLLGLELEAPFHDRGGAGGSTWRDGVGDLGRDLVRRDAIPAGPCLDDFNVVGRASVDSGNAGTRSARLAPENPTVPDKVGRYPPQERA